MKPATSTRAGVRRLGARLPARLSRYAIGSLVALVTSEVTLLVLYGNGLVGASAASVIAFFAGAVPNYLLNRLWVWKRRDRVRVRRELVPYVAVSAITLVVAAVAMDAAAAIGPSSHRERTLFVGFAYIVVYGALFLLKYAVYQRFIFGTDESRVERSRDPGSRESRPRG
ncbi:MAG: hypothetical protein JWL73_4006 [Actinomycetia bacterium]|nr:hypothetical protein [Actinomycetes bacterium]